MKLLSRRRLMKWLDCWVQNYCLPLYTVDDTADSIVDDVFHKL